MTLIAYIFDIENWRWLGETRNLTFLARGFMVTLALALLTMVVGLVMALALGLLGTSKIGLVRRAVSLWVDLWRNLPVLFTILYLYLIMPSWLRRGYEAFLPDFVPSAFGTSAFLAALLGLLLYHSCVMAEIVRAGIVSIERGQSHAASSLGMNYWQRMRVVILPQALRRMVPALLAQLVTITKDTSLASVIGVPELLRNGAIVSNTSGSIFIQDSGSQAPVLHVFLFIGIVFIVGNYALSLLSRRLGGREASPRKRLRRAVEVETGQAA